MKKIAIPILLGTILLTACDSNTYTLKDVEVTNKESGKYSYDFYIEFQKGERKAKVEVTEDDYNRIEVGQHLNVDIDNSTGNLEDYQINMGEENKK
jgi:hypothetical protein